MMKTEIGSIVVEVDSMTRTETGLIRVKVVITIRMEIGCHWLIKTLKKGWKLLESESFDEVVLVLKEREKVKADEVD